MSPQLCRAWGLLAGRAPGLGPLAQLAANISRATGGLVTARFFTPALVMVAATSKHRQHRPGFVNQTVLQKGRVAGPHARAVGPPHGPQGH